MVSPHEKSMHHPLNRLLWPDSIAIVGAAPTGKHRTRGQLVRYLVGVGYRGLILPMAFSAFGTFLMRQFMADIPRSYDEAAEIDGASPLQIFVDVILPLSRPGLVTLAILTFLGNFQSFFWPLLLVKDEGLRTLPIGLLSFQTFYGQQTELIMAATAMNIVPLIVFFVVMQKQLVSGIQLGGIKG